MADTGKDPLSAVKDTNLLQRALELGMQADTPEFYHFLGLAPGNKGYEGLKKAQDVGYTDHFLDSLTQGRHLQQYRDLADVQEQVSKTYRALQLISETEKLKERRESIDFRPGVQMPSPAQPSEAVSPFGPQFNMPNPGITAPNMPFAPEPVGSANAPRIRPPMSAVESVPFSQAQPARPMKIGGYETFDPQEQAFLQENLLKGPVTKDKLAAVKGVIPGLGESVVTPQSITGFREDLKQGTKGPGLPNAVANKVLEIEAKATEAKTNIEKLQQARNKFPEGSPERAEIEDVITKERRSSEHMNVDQDNVLSMGMFQKPFMKLTNEPLTEQQAAALQRKGYRHIKPGMTGPDAVVFQKQGMIEDQRAAETRARVAETIEIKRSTPVGPEASKYRRLKPDGTIETAKGTMNEKDLTAGGFIDTSHLMTYIDAANDMQITADRVKQLHTYAKEIIKAEPGLIKTGFQAAKLAVLAATKGGKPTPIMGPDGKTPLTLGEVASLYEREKTAMMEAVQRSVNQIRGAGTEGDVQRGLRGMAGGFDTMQTMNQIFNDLHTAFGRTKTYALKTVFGDDAVKAKPNVAVPGVINERLNQLGVPP